MTTIHANSGHTLYVAAVDTIPEICKERDSFNKFYVVKNWDKDGVVFFYMAKGHKESPNQVCVWFRSGSFWAGFGTNFKTAIDGAQRDGWMHA